MDDTFKIFVDQLRDGHVELIDETLDPSFIDLHDPDLTFQDPVRVEGEAYMADDDFVMRLDVETSALVPCAICNTMIAVPMEIRDAYIIVPRKDIKTAIFNFKEPLREQIVLDAPKHAECNGKCPRRKEIAKYLKESSEDPEDDSNDRYHPFADLDFEAK